MFNFSGSSTQANLMSSIVSEDVQFSTHITQERRESDFHHDSIHAGLMQGQVLSSGAILKGSKHDPERFGDAAGIRKADDFQPSFFGLSYLA